MDDINVNKNETGQPVPANIPDQTGVAFALLVSQKLDNLEEFISRIDPKKADLTVLDEAQKKLLQLRQDLSEMEGSDDLLLLLDRLNKIQGKLTGMYRDAGLSASVYATQEAVQEYHANEPQLAAPDPRAQIPPKEHGNLFLATGMMAILFAIQMALIQIQLQNKEAERQCKMLGFDNIRELGDLEAQAAYNSDMDQANMYFSQAVCSLIGGSMTIGFAAIAAGKHTAASKDLNDLREQRKKIDEDLKLAESGKKRVKTEVKDNTTGISTTQESEIDFKDEAEKNETIKNLREDIRQNGQDIYTKSSELQMDMGIRMWRDTLPQASQAFTQTAQGVLNYMWTAAKAEEDYKRTLYSIAKDVSQKYLQSAMDAFSGEGRNIQAIVDFLTQAAQKNTQWATIRA